MEIALLTVFPFIVVFAALSDLFTMTITNRTTILLAVFFFPMALALGLAPDVIMWHLAAGLLTLLVGMALFYAGWIGGGDAKLFAAIALWLGWNDLLAFGILTSFIGAVLAILVLLVRAYVSDMVIVQRGPLETFIARSKEIPYGIALSAAGLMLYENSIWFETAVNLAA